MRLVAFPLLRIIDGKCECGDDKCNRVGKHPAIHWGELEYGSPVPMPDADAGYGLKTGALPRGSDVFVLDFDTIAALEEFLATHEVPDTFTVATPRGAHLYFKHPGFPVRNSTGALATSVDVRGDGGFVVGPGSPHKSGKKYEVIDDREPANAPEWLLEKIKKPTSEVQAFESDITEPVERARRRDMFARYLTDEATPCVQGKGGDQHLFEVVQRGAYDLRLPTEDVLSLVREHFDPRCQPPWGDELEERVLHKSNYAKTTSTRPRLEPPPAEIAALFLEASIPINRQIVSEIAKAKKNSGGPSWGEWNKKVDPPTYLVSPLMPVSTVGMLVALGSSVKTWTALSIARAVTLGESWLGRYPTKQGRALVLDYESGDYELHRRIQLLEKNGDPLDGLGAWPYPQSRIDDVEFWKELARIPDLSLVVVDSFAAGADGVDENVSNAALPLKLAALFTNVNDATVIFIHHSRKDETDERKAMRGNTSIYAACDWAYRFEPVDETKVRRRMKMCCIKPCMGPRPEDVFLELTDERGLTCFSEDSGVKVQAEDNSVEAISRAILLALQSGPIETKALVATRVGKRTDRVGVALDALLVRGEIAKLSDVGYQLDSDEARMARVRAVLNGRFRNIPMLSKAAQVGVPFVIRLVTTGVLFKSADGRFLEKLST